MSSKKITVPKYLYELFGRETTVLEMLAIFATASVVTTILIGLDFAYFKEMGLIKSVILAILIFDITAGVIANLTEGTNDYYAQQAVKRNIFIIIHIQPLLFSWFLGNYLIESLFAWLYAVTASLLINSLVENPFQRTIAAASLVLGIAILLVINRGMPTFLLAMLVLYMIKLIYSFSVNHTLGKKGWE
ncbi:MAG: hypothetical protein ACQESO_09835 [Bacillota bacterium]